MQFSPGRAHVCHLPSCYVVGLYVYFSKRSV